MKVTPVEIHHSPQSVPEGYDKDTFGFLDIFLMRGFRIETDFDQVTILWSADDLPMPLVYWERVVAMQDGSERVTFGEEWLGEEGDLGLGGISDRSNIGDTHVLF